MAFMSYNINICFDSDGRVEILLGKLLHYGFSIRHPCRQDWKCDKLTEKHFNAMENLLHLFFACTAKSTFEDTAISTLCHKGFCTESGQCITGADVTFLTLVCGTAFFYRQQHRHVHTVL